MVAPTVAALVMRLAALTDATMAACSADWMVDWSASSLAASSAVVMVACSVENWAASRAERSAVHSAARMAWKMAA